MDGYVKETDINKNLKDMTVKMQTTHFLARPVEVSNMKPSLRRPNSAAFPLAANHSNSPQH